MSLSVHATPVVSKVISLTLTILFLVGRKIRPAYLPNIL